MESVAKIAVAAIFIGLVLWYVEAFDDGPEIRKNLAACQMLPGSHTETGAWNDSFLGTCMQAKGFIVDAKANEACDGFLYPEITDACYRQDGWLAAQIVQIRHNIAKAYKPYAGH